MSPSFSQRKLRRYYFEVLRANIRRPDDYHYQNTHSIEYIDMQFRFMSCRNIIVMPLLNRAFSFTRVLMTEMVFIAAADDFHATFRCHSCFHASHAHDATAGRHDGAQPHIA